MRENLTPLWTNDTRLHTRSYEILYQIRYQILRDPQHYEAVVPSVSLDDAGVVHHPWSVTNNVSAAGSAALNWRLSAPNSSGELEAPHCCSTMMKAKQGDTVVIDN